MDELIKRLEQATEGSDGLDRAIAAACKIGWSSDEDGNFGGYDLLPRRCHFSRSIDAALTLMGPKCWWSIETSAGFSSDGNGVYSADIWNWHGEWHSVTSAGPAIALCIAALRARVSEAAREGSEK